MINLSTEPDWFGTFTRNQYRGALPNGTRVIKVNTESGDINPLGATATVLGSMGHPTIGIGYFLEWDARPRCAVFVADWKVARLYTGGS